MNEKPYIGLFIFSCLALTYEVVRHGPHSLVRHDDPDDDQVPAGGHGGHQHEQQGPEDLSPEGEQVGVL